MSRVDRVVVQFQGHSGVCLSNLFSSLFPIVYGNRGVRDTSHNTSDYLQVFGLLSIHIFVITPKRSVVGLRKPRLCFPAGPMMPAAAVLVIQRPCCLCEQGQSSGTPFGDS